MSETPMTDPTPEATPGVTPAANPAVNPGVTPASAPVTPPVTAPASRWGTKVTVSWVALLAILATSFAVILVFRVFNAVLPSPEEALTRTTVTVGSSEGWNTTLTSADGTELVCPPDSAIFINGWSCSGTQILATEISTPEDKALAVRRNIRAGASSVMPEGEATTEANVTSVRLSAEETAAIFPKAEAGTVMHGVLVADPEGSEGTSFIVTVKGAPEEVDQLVEQIVKAGTK